MSILNIENMTHSFGEKRIFNNINLRLLPGDKMGLTGLNGSGKSTLINIMAGSIYPDSGAVEWLQKIKVGYLDQYARIDPELTILQYLQWAYKELFDIEAQLEAANVAMAECESGAKLENIIAAAARLQSQLEQRGFYEVNSHIAKVAAGLGITPLGMETPVGRLSGGQRAKVLLAKLLLEAPDALLLDEPTNFLDRQHIDWLAKFLRSFSGAFVIVSHDPFFLSSVTNCICDIEFCSVSRYTGNYDSFIKQKEQRKEEYIRSYARQRQEIEKLEDYISRNMARASTSNMAKSRLKKLNKIERIEKPVIQGKPSFKFINKPVNEQVLLEVKGLSVGYDRVLLSGIDMKVKQGEKVAIKGFNGIGKTTLLKTIAGAIPALGGRYMFGDNVAVGYYEQDHAFKDAGISPIQELLSDFPALLPKEARKWLARCGLKQEHVDKKLAILSGGEQAKVKLCKLMMKPYSLLVLDEPTNHLNVNAKEILRETLKEFKGGVIIVSHEESFYKDFVVRVFDVEKLKIG